jgi:NAD(P)-dependent dehydrogenase (short-subunit alcohol dehydrogenase family)
VALRTDVSRREDLQAAVERVVREWGRLDILVNNAFDVSTAGTGGAVQVSEEDWDAGMNVMVKAIYRAVKLAVPEMIKSGAGSIVNISSVHGLLTAPGFLVYETAKAAVIGMTRQMACEYGPDGIRVNSILPGHMVTERLQPMWDENPSGHAYFENQYPLRRLGTTDDIAQGVVFLCSEEASFITGHALVIDGGLSIQLQENFGVRQGRYMVEHPETRIP